MISIKTDLRHKTAHFREATKAHIRSMTANEQVHRLVYLEVINELELAIFSRKSVNLDDVVNRSESTLNDIKYCLKDQVRFDMLVKFAAKEVEAAPKNKTGREAIAHLLRR